MGYKRSEEDRRRGKKNINASKKKRARKQRSESRSEVWIALSKQEQAIAKSLGIVIHNQSVRYDDWLPYQ